MNQSVADQIRYVLACLRIPETDVKITDSLTMVLFRCHAAGGLLVEYRAESSAKHSTLDDLHVLVSWWLSHCLCRVNGRGGKLPKKGLADSHREAFVGFIVSTTEPPSLPTQGALTLESPEVAALRRENAELRARLATLEALEPAR